MKYFTRFLCFFCSLRLVSLLILPFASSISRSYQNAFMVERSLYHSLLMVAIVSIVTGLYGVWVVVVLVVVVVSGGGVVWVRVLVVVGGGGVWVVVLVLSGSYCVWVWLILIGVVWLWEVLWVGNWSCVGFVVGRVNMEGAEISCGGEMS